MKISFKISLIFLLIMFCAEKGISQITHPEPKTLEIGSKAPAKDYKPKGIDLVMISPNAGAPRKAGGL